MLKKPFVFVARSSLPVRKSCIYECMFLAIRVKLVAGEAKCRISLNRVIHPRIRTIPTGLKRSTGYGVLWIYYYIGHVRSDKVKSEGDCELALCIVEKKN